MQFPQKLLLSMTGAFIALCCMPLSCGRALPVPSLSPQINVTSPELTATPQSNESHVSHVSPSIKVHRLHIVRKREHMPLGFDTLHLPCDMDAANLEHIIPFMPNHCIWLYNIRYVSEHFYKSYKLVQLESFFFGQYYERFRRYEMDPHNF